MWSRFSFSKRPTTPALTDDDDDERPNVDVLTSVREEHPNLSIFHQSSPPTSPTTTTTKKNTFKRISKQLLKEKEDENGTLRIGPPKKMRPSLSSAHTTNPSAESLRLPSTPPQESKESRFASLRSILKPNNTPGTGQSVRFFSRDAYRVISPDHSSSELHEPPVPPLPVVHAAASSKKVRPSLQAVFSPPPQPPKEEPTSPTSPRGSMADFNILAPSSPPDTSRMFEFTSSIRGRPSRERAPLPSIKDIPSIPTTSAAPPRFLDAPFELGDPVSLTLDGFAAKSGVSALADQEAPFDLGLSFDPSTNDSRLSTQDNTNEETVIRSSTPTIMLSHKKDSGHDRSHSFSFGQTVFHSMVKSQERPPQSSLNRNRAQSDTNLLESFLTSPQNLPVRDVKKRPEEDINDMSQAEVVYGPVSPNAPTLNGREGESNPFEKMLIGKEEGEKNEKVEEKKAEADPFGANGAAWYTPGSVPPSPPQGVPVPTSSSTSTHSRHPSQHSQSSALSIPSSATSHHTSFSRLSYPSHNDKQQQQDTELVWSLRTQLALQSSMSTTLEQDLLASQQVVIELKERLEDREKECLKRREVCRGYRKRVKEVEELVKELTEQGPGKGSGSGRDSGDMSVSSVNASEVSLPREDEREGSRVFDEASADAFASLHKRIAELERERAASLGTQDELERVKGELEEARASRAKEAQGDGDHTVRSLGDLQAVEGLKEEVERLRRELARKERAMVDEEEELRRTRTDRDALMDSYTSLSKSHSTLRDEHRELQSAMSTLETEHNALLEEHAALGEEEGALREEVEALKEEVESMREEAEAFHMEVDGLHGKLEEAEERLREVEVGEQGRVQWEEEKGELTTKLRNAHQEAQRVSDRIRQLEQEKGYAEQEKVHVQDSLARLQDAFRSRDSELTKMKDKARMYEDEVEDLRSMLTKQKREHARTVDDQSRKVSDLVAREVNARVSLESTLREHSTLQVEAESAKERVRSLEGEVERMRKEVGEMRRRDAEWGVREEGWKKERVKWQDERENFLLALDGKQQELAMLKRKTGVGAGAKSGLTGVGRKDSLVGETPAPAGARRRESSIFATPSVVGNISARPPSVLSDGGSGTERKSMVSRRKLSDPSTGADKGVADNKSSRAALGRGSRLSMISGNSTSALSAQVKAAHRRSESINATMAKAPTTTSISAGARPRASLGSSTASSATVTPGASRVRSPTLSISSRAGSVSPQAPGRPTHRRPSNSIEALKNLETPKARPSSSMPSLGAVVAGGAGRMRTKEEKEGMLA